MAEPLIFSLAARRGGETALSAAVEAAFGAPLPPPGRSVDAGDWRFFWSGRAVWLAETRAARGPAGAALAALAPHARIVDLSDAWARFALDGPEARARLQRLAPIDLHPSVFPADATARTVLEHIPTILHARGPDRIEALAPRSMAQDAARLLAP